MCHVWAVVLVYSLVGPMKAVQVCLLGVRLLVNASEVDQYPFSDSQTVDVGGANDIHCIHIAVGHSRHYP